MGVLMKFDIYSLRDLQNLQSLLITVKQVGGNSDTLFDAVNRELDSRLQSISLTPTTPTFRRRPDNITTCSVCGKSAIVVPLSSTDRTNTATHAIQCQNRPAKDQPWLAGMCGHTEYIVRGDK